MRTLAALLIALVAGCATPVAPAPDPAALTDMRDAASAAETAWGVPADVTLAVAYVETRWQVHDGDAEAHGARLVGVGALRPWIEPDPVSYAERALGVDRETLERDPVAGILATAAVLDRLAERHLGANRPADPSAWAEVLGDYAGLSGAEARISYVEQILDVLRRGVSAPAADGTVLSIAPRPVLPPETVGAAREYAGAEYPDARWVAASSTNYTSGRGGNPIRYVIVHTTQGSYSGAISWFQNPSADVSAHFVIRSSDGEVTQMVSEANTGWHAGNWSYNQQSVGIEHEGFVAEPDRWYTDAMYRSSARLTRYLCDKYGIPIDRSHIIGHVEVPGASHTDPGSGWDWARYMALVRGTPTGPEYAAELSGQEAPAELISGERVPVWVELRNTGSTAWDLAGTRLGTTGPRDHDSPFYDAENWVSPSRASPPDHSTYGPGEVGRFTFMIAAPDVDEPTVVRDTFGLVQEGVAWFGPEDITIEVMVRPRDEDADGVGGRLDCDDADPTIFTGATEQCGDGIDQDCDGVDLACEEPEIPPDPVTPPVDPMTPADPPVDPDARLTGGCATAPGAAGWPSSLLALLGLCWLIGLRRR